MPALLIVASTVTTFLEVYDTRVFVYLVTVLVLLVSLFAVRLLTPGDGKQAKAVAQRSEDTPNVSTDTVPRREIVVDQDTDGGDPATAPYIIDPAIARFRRLPTIAEAQAAEAKSPADAAMVWERLGIWENAARCYTLVGEPGKAAKIQLALGKPEAAALLLREALTKNPANEAIRFMLIETLFDLNREPQAKDLIAGVTSDEAPIQASPDFLESVGKIYETRHRIDLASIYYRQAITLDSQRMELEQRLLYLKQLKRLQQADVAGIAGPSIAKEMLDQIALESRSAVPKLPSGNAPVVPGGFAAVVPNPALEGHEIIVGHMALGFRQSENPPSVRSIYSRSRRFVLDRIISESPRAAVFAARDRLLDFPVALKLHRLPNDFSDMAVLRQRLKAVARLNHPNLAKVTFVDREGPVIVVATEFLPGGNLPEFMKKLGGAGIPLILRLSMHLASALQAAHRRGVPHGDVRPENIIIGTDQRIKLVDFALSPIPVRSHHPVTTPTESGNGTQVFGLAEGITAEGVQSDLIQFADLMEFMLKSARRPVESNQPTTPSRTESGAPDPAEELRELIAHLRSGGAHGLESTSQVLEQIFARAVPANRTNDKAAGRN